MTGRRRWLPTLCLIVACLSLAAGPALAHGGSLGSGGRQSVAVPTWLVLLTGGAAVGASFLLASFVTDRRLIRAVESWSRTLRAAGVPAGLIGAVRVAGVAALVGTVGVATLGPQQPLANLGLLVVWVGWWAGYTMSTYLLGNSWPALNPWRTVAAVLPSMDHPYPERAGVWPATVALLALVWLEVASPVADAPDVLAGVIVAYTLVTLTGAAVYGPTVWFSRADPVARVFHHYGHVAPIQRTADGLAVRLPGTSLTNLDLSARGAVAFVVALLWVTTFDGFVSTPAWRTVVDVVSPPVPLAVLYPIALVAGFAAFLAIFYGASRSSKRLADTYLTEGTLVRQFAPSLLAIAAGYHLAHYLGYFISLAPAALAVAAAPLSPPVAVPVAVLPGWFDTVGMGAILLGHLLAIWIAHGTAYDLFPGRLQAIRSQYPFIAVMVFYTTVSLWIIAQPEVAPP